MSRLLRSARRVPVCSPSVRPSSLPKVCDAAAIPKEAKGAETEGAAKSDNVVVREKVKSCLNDEGGRDFLVEAQYGWTAKLADCNEHRRVITRVLIFLLILKTLLDKKRNKSLHKGP